MCAEGRTSLIARPFAGEQYVRRAMRVLVGFVVVVMVAAGCGDDASDTGAAGSSTEVTDGSGATSAPAATSTTAASATTTSSAASTTATTPITPAPAIDLAGRTFVSTELTGFEAPAGTQLTFTFEADRFSVSGGCNQLMSGWVLEGDVLVVEDLASTMMACEPAALMDLDTWVSALLASDPTVALDGDTLTLTEGQSSITLAAS
jgi:heat shock protein HslJ